MILFMLLVLPFSPLILGLSLACDAMRSFELWYLTIAACIFVAIRLFNWNIVLTWEDDTPCARWHLAIRQPGPIVL